MAPGDGTTLDGPVQHSPLPFSTHRTCISNRWLQPGWITASKVLTCKQDISRRMLQPQLLFPADAGSKATIVSRYQWLLLADTGCFSELTVYLQRLRDLSSSHIYHRGQRCIQIAPTEHQPFLDPHAQLLSHHTQAVMGRWLETPECVSSFILARDFL